MDMSDFTLGIPVYNDGKYLRKTLESCVNQTSRLILSDNGSTDDGQTIAEEFAAKYPHIRYVRQSENLGGFGNFKFLLSQIETPYFMWLGAHDILGENYIPILLETIKAHPDAVLAVGKIFHINEDDSLRDKVTDLSTWHAALQTEDDPLKRMMAFMKDQFGSSRHDSFLLHGIFRTDLLRKAWFDVPCLAFDDGVLARAAAQGKIVYNNDALFYARWFRNTRKKADEPKRIFHGGNVPQEGGAMTRHIIALKIMETALEIAQTRESTRDAFDVFRMVETLALNPKRARKMRRLKWIGGATIVLLGIVGALCFF